MYLITYTAKGVSCFFLSTMQGFVVNLSTLDKSLQAHTFLFMPLLLNLNLPFLSRMEMPFVMSEINKKVMNYSSNLDTVGIVIRNISC